ncbi:MAG: hypothetical protein LBQ34_06275 [Alphaproteobacteria bacterium]|jgi:hypothetical protein|nr:hypothetical protein [Alphaproteobacteria bacterium]
MNKILFNIFPILLFSASTTFAGQIINITKNPTGSVYGNADDVNNPYSIKQNKDPNYNTVNINKNYVAPYNIYGGRSSNGTASGNAVLIEDGTFGGDIYGGYSSNGTVSGNRISIGGGTFGRRDFQQYIYGGYSDANGDAINNEIKISGNLNFTRISLFGGKSTNGAASGNAVSIEGGTFDYSIYGGYSSNGTAFDNKVLIENGTFGGKISASYSIYGGYSTKGEVSGNVVSIEGGTFKYTDYYSGFSIYGGYSSTYGDAKNNTLVISGNPSFAMTQIYGGRSSNGTASGNTVSIEGGAFYVGPSSSVNKIYGGFSNNGDAINNTITISGNTIFTNTGFYGGVAKIASGNTVNIINAEITGGISISGGSGGGTDGGAVSGNTVNIAASKMTSIGSIYGGYASYWKDVNDNTVNIKGLVLTQSSGNIYGGVVGNGGHVERNIINIDENSNNIYRYVIGGTTETYAGSVGATSAMYNKIYMKSGSIVGGGIYGGKTSDLTNSSDYRYGYASYNYVYLSNVSGGPIFGGAGGYEAINNTVEIESGNIGSVTGGYANNYYSTALADNNIVVIKNGNFSSSITGGEAKSSNSGSPAVAENNTVSIEGGAFSGGNIYGGYANGGSNSISGDSSGSRNNTVSISGGVFNGNKVYGGFGGNVYIGWGSPKPGNILNISGNASFTDSYLYGGDVGLNIINIAGNPIFKNSYLYGGGYYSNIINISGNPDLSGAYLFGGSPNESGNILNLHTNITVLTAGYFQNYNFDADDTNINNPVLKATESAIDMNNSVVGLYLKDNSKPLYVGDKLWLVANMSGGNISQASGTMKAGATRLYDWKMLISNGNLYAVIDDGKSCITNQSFCEKPDISLPYIPDTGGGDNNGNGNGGDNNGNGGGNTCRAGDCGGGDNGSGSGSNNGGAGRLNPETKSLLESYISSMSVLTNGADLVAEGGINSLDSALKNNDDGWFSSINASSIKLNNEPSADSKNVSAKTKLASQASSTSYVNTQNANIILGVGSKFDNNIIGAFLEAGGGKHDTYNEFEDSIVKGNGSNTYAGAGLLSRVGFDFIYFDASIRGGYVMTQYQADYSEAAKYNIGNIYYGGHAGILLLQNIGALTLNEYVKYLATVQQGKTAVLDSKEEIQFANIMSSRAVAGIRAKYEVIYIGVAREEELAGIANAKTANMAIDAPSIKGGTNIAEAGIDYSFMAKPSVFNQKYSRVSRYSAPKSSNSFNIGLGGKYYMGVKNGYSANARVGYMF